MQKGEPIVAERQKKPFLEYMAAEGIFRGIVALIFRWIFNKYKAVDPVGWTRFVKKAKANEFVTRTVGTGIGSVLNAIVGLLIKVIPALEFMRNASEMFLDEIAAATLLYASQQTIDESLLVGVPDKTADEVLNEFITFARSNLATWKDAIATFFLPVAGLFRGHQQDRDLHLLAISNTDGNLFTNWADWLSSLSEEDQAYIHRFWGPLANLPLLEKIMAMQPKDRMPFIRMYAGKGLWQKVEDTADAIGEPLEKGFKGISRMARKKIRDLDAKDAARTRQQNRARDRARANWPPFQPQPVVVAARRPSWLRRLMLRLARISPWATARRAAHVGH